MIDDGLGGSNDANYCVTWQLLRFVRHAEYLQIQFLVGFDLDNDIGKKTTTVVIEIKLVLYGEETIYGGAHRDQTLIIWLLIAALVRRKLTCSLAL